MKENVDVNTAKTYATVGFIFYAISTILLLTGIGIISWVFSNTVYPWDNGYMWNFNANIPVMVIFLIGLIFIISLFFTFWAYMTYKRIDDGKYAEARTHALILGIFGLFFGIFLGGLFFLLAYSKLGDVLWRSRDPYYSTTQMPTRVQNCPGCGQVVEPGSQFCANCGTKLS